MDRPYDTYLIVKMPDGTTYEVETNLLDIKREFYCPICSASCDDSKISLQSLSDHLSRHYIENVHAAKIQAAVTEDIRPRGVIYASDYDRAVEVTTRPDGHYTGLTEEEMIELAMAESMREATIAEVPSVAVTADLAAADPPSVTGVATRIVSQANASVTAGTDNPIYPPRRRKEQ